VAGGNKRLLSKSSAVSIAIGVLLVSVMTLIGTSAFLRVVHFEVSGSNVYTTKEIIDASGISIGDNLMTVNARNVSRHIRQALPFVKEAQISRKLPDTVLIEVNESVAIASIKYNRETLILDSSGRVLMRLDEDPGGLIEIRGLEVSDAVEGNVLKPVLGSETNLQYMQDILAAIENEGLESDVSYLDVSNITNLCFGYRNIYRVVLGGIRDLKYKIEDLRTTVEKLELRSPNTPGDINMSDPTEDYKFTPHR